MAADGNLLQGEVNENPQSEQGNVEKLLLEFMKALLNEQRMEHARTSPGPSSGNINSEVRS